MWLMGKVLDCLAFLPAPSLSKRRKTGFVKVADALSLDLGFLGRSFYVREFSSPPWIFFFLFLTSYKWGSKLFLVFFYFVVYLFFLLSVFLFSGFLGLFFVFGFYFVFWSLLLLFFSISGG